MTYNLTNLSKWNLVDTFVELNVQANGILGLLFLIALFVITFVTLLNYGSKIAYSSSCFITLIAGLLFVWLGWINVHYVSVLIVMTGVGIILLISEGG